MIKLELVELVDAFGEPIFIKPKAVVALRANDENRTEIYTVAESESPENAGPWLVNGNVHTVYKKLRGEA